MPVTPEEKRRLIKEWLRSRLTEMTAPGNAHQDDRDRSQLPLLIAWSGGSEGFTSIRPAKAPAEARLLSSMFPKTGVMDVRPSFPAKTVTEFISYRVF